MTQIIEGRFVTDTEAEILNRMVDNAETHFGESLSDDSLSTIRTFYLPIVKEIAELQDEVSVVLDSAQIDHASGQALDFLTALINVTRREAEHASGTVTMSRSSAANQDYNIPKGTIVQTNANVPIKFKTTEVAILNSGNTSIDIPVRAVNGGVEENVAAGTIIVFEDKPAGIEDVTNSDSMTGGKLRETDEELRERAKKQLADGSAATTEALLSAVSDSNDDIVSVTVNENDTDIDNTDSGGLPPHSIEVVVEAPSTAYEDAARALILNKAAGIEDYGGVSGSKITRTVTVNGEDKDVHLSSPTVIEIYADVELKSEENYAGDTAVMNRVVEYIGGFLEDGSPEQGELDAGHDVLFGEVEYAVRDVPGVFDVTSLEVGTSADPTGTSDVTIAKTEVAKLNGQNDIAVTSTDV